MIPPPLQRRLPPAPGLVEPTLARLNVTTVGDLLSLDVNHLRMRGVGKKKKQVIAKFREEILRACGLWEQSEPFDLPPKAPPLPEPPRRVRRLVDELGIATPEEVLRFDLRRLELLPRVGPTTRRAFLRWQEEVSVATNQSIPFLSREDEQTRSSAGLVQVAFDQMKPRVAQMLTARYIQGKTLEEIGRAHSVMRERVRQIQNATRARLHRLLGEEVSRALSAEFDLNYLGGHLLHRPNYTGEGEPPSLGALHLLAEIATGDSWFHDGESMLFRGERCALRDLQEQIKIATAQQVELSAADLTHIGESVKLPGPAVRLLLLSRGRWLPHEDEGLRRNLRRTPRRDALLLWVMGRGGAVHQREAGAWLLDWMRIPPAEREERLGQASISAGAILERLPDLLRYNKGTFIHRDHLPITLHQQDALVSFCVQRLAAERQPMSTRVLLSEARSQGLPVRGCTPHLLKDLLRRHPEVRPLRKFLVLWHEAPESEAQATLRSRLEQIVAGSPKPLSIEEMLALLPAKSNYHRITIVMTLNRMGLHLDADAGGYLPVAEVLARRTEISEQSYRLRQKGWLWMEVGEHLGVGGERARTLALQWAKAMGQPWPAYAGRDRPTRRRDD